MGVSGGTKEERKTNDEKVPEKWQMQTSRVDRPRYAAWANPSSPGVEGGRKNRLGNAIRGQLLTLWLVLGWYYWGFTGSARCEP